MRYPLHIHLVWILYPCIHWLPLCLFRLMKRNLYEALLWVRLTLNIVYEWNRMHSRARYHLFASICMFSMFHWASIEYPVCIIVHHVLFQMWLLFTKRVESLTKCMSVQSIQRMHSWWARYHLFASINIFSMFHWVSSMYHLWITSYSKCDYYWPSV